MSPDSLEHGSAVIAVGGEPADGRTTAPAPDIAGFIDVAAGRKVSGWVWDRTRPDRRFEVEIRFDDAPIAAARADRMRSDLAGAGIGDGRYGFEGLHTKDITEENCHRVTALVQPGDGGDPVSLVNRAAKAARYAVLKPDDVQAIRSAIDEWPAEQRELIEQLGQRFMAMAAELRRLRDVVGTVRPPQDAATDETPDARQDGVLAEALAELRRTQEALDRRMAEIDVFHNRFDGALSELKRDRKRPDTPPVDHTLRRMVFLLSLVSGTSLLIGIVSLLR
jgi:hypothetical protein